MSTKKQNISVSEETESPFREDAGTESAFRDVVSGNPPSGKLPLEVPPVQPHEMAQAVMFEDTQESKEELPAIDVKIIETALQKENITAAVITKLKQDFSGLTINGIDDREGFKKVAEARKLCKSYRVVATKICKKGRAEAIAIQQAWIAKEKEVVDAIKQVEAPLSEEEDKYYAELEALKFKLEQIEKLPVRKEKLLTFPEYEYKEENLASLEAELIKMDDVAFETFYNKKMSEHLAKKEAELKEQQETAAREKAAADEKVRAEQERITKEQQEREEKFRKENAKMMAERFTARSTTLINLGMKWTGTAFVLEECTIVKAVIESSDSDMWETQLAELKPTIATITARLKKEEEDRIENIRKEAVEKEKAEAEARIREKMMEGRVNQLLAIGLSVINAREGACGYTYGDDVRAWVLNEQIEELLTEEWNVLFEEIKTKVEAKKTAIAEAKAKADADARAETERKQKEEEAIQKALMPDLEKAKMIGETWIQQSVVNFGDIKDEEIKRIIRVASQQIRVTADSVMTQLESFKKGKKKK